MTAEHHRQLDTKSDTFFTKVAVMMTIWVLGLVLISIFVNLTWFRALAAGLLFVSMFPTLVLWFDILEPLRRTCRACKKRGVTKGTDMFFDANEDYDKWNYCRNCRAVYLHIGDRWLAQSEVINPSEPSDAPKSPVGRECES